MATNQALELFKPVALTPWRTPTSWGGKPWHGWYVGFARNRDSSTLEESNFRVFQRELDRVPAMYVDDTDNARQSYRTDREDWTLTSTVYLVRESHWACGWLEWIAIHESDEAALRAADEMLCALSNYPVLDEDNLGEMEHEAVCSYWDRLSFRDRIECCADEGESIFAARRDTPPSSVYDYLRDTLCT